MDDDEVTRQFATIRELHDVERRITDAINNLALKFETCVGPLAIQVADAIKHADKASEKATAAHTRIDSLQRMIIPILIGWLATALVGGYGLYSALQFAKGVVR